MVTQGMEVLEKIMSSINERSLLAEAQNPCQDFALGRGEGTTSLWLGLLMTSDDRGGGGRC